MKKLIALFAISTLSIVACSNSQTNIVAVNNQDLTNAPAPFRIYSTAFKQGDTIPSVYTCDSTNISPQLHWNKPFANTASYALIVDDPDAPMGTWVHWVLYNIPASDTVLQTNTPKDTMLANGARQGIPSFGKPGYGGPCPPNGYHHYHFKIYALDIMLPYPAGLTKKQLLAVIKGHILAEADLVGVYKKIKS